MIDKTRFYIDGIAKDDNLVFTVVDKTNPKKIIVTKDHAKEVLIEVGGSEEISVDFVDDGYKVKRTVTRFVPAQVTEELNFSVHDGSDLLSFGEWLKGLSDDELEAACQIYYDRWNFRSGSELDRAKYDSSELERKRRSTKK